MCADLDQPEFLSSRSDSRFSESVWPQREAINSLSPTWGWKLDISISKNLYRLSIEIFISNTSIIYGNTTPDIFRSGINQGMGYIAVASWTPFFSCDQAALQMVFSVCLSVCPSHLFDYVPIIGSSWNFIYQFTKVITNDQRKFHVKGQGQRSKVKVTEVTTQLNRFRTVTPVWIHIWWWNDTYSLMLLSGLLTPVWIHQWLRNDAQSLK